MLASTGPDAPVTHGPVRIWDLVRERARLGVVQVPRLPISRDRELGVVVTQVRPAVVVTPSTWRGIDYRATALPESR